MMLDKGRISSVQLLFLLLIADLATSFLYVPAITTKGAGPDAWISLLVPATLYALMVALVCVLLARRFPNEVFTQYLPKIVGKIPGKILGFLYIGVFIHITSVMVIEGAQFINTNFLIQTPVLVLQLVLAGVAVYGVYLGIEVIARHNEIVFPIFVFSLAILIILVVKDINPSNFLPILENGWMPVLKGSMTPAAWRGEVFIVLMLFPYLNQKNEGVKAAVGMVLIAGVIATAVVATTIGVFGDLFTSRLTYSGNTLARYISVAGILERMELVIVIIWVAGVTVKLAIFYHVSSIAAATTLGIKEYKWAAIPVAGATILAGNIFYGTYIQVVEFLSKVWPYYGYTVELIIPALVLLIAILRKKEMPQDG